MPAPVHAPLPADALRWRCPVEAFPFASTSEVEPADGIVGQDAAVEALLFGLAFHAPGQNIFVRGLAGTGRATLVHRLVEKAVPCAPAAPDRVFVANFARPERPRLLTLPRGQAQTFRRLMDRFVDYVAKELVPDLSSSAIRARTAALEREALDDLRSLAKPFEAELEAAGYALLPIQVGPVTRQTILPLIDGQPVAPDQIESHRASGKVTPEDLARFDKDIEAFGTRMQEIGEKLQDRTQKQVEEVQALLRKEARALLVKATRALRSAFAGSDVRGYLESVYDDVIHKQLGKLPDDASFSERYRVNVVLAHEVDDPCPALVERTPTVLSLLGSIDILPDGEEDPAPPHMAVRAGSLLQADGGYLVVDTKELLAERGAWRGLVRTLRTGELEIQVGPEPFTGRMAFIKPDVIPIDVKVILIGDTTTWQLLDELDPDFRDLFKVLADFEASMARDAVGLSYYAAVISRIQHEEGLLPFDATALAALCEHGVRVAADGGRLTARFGRLADIAREAAHLAHVAGEVVVTGNRVRETVRRTKRRGDLPSRRFQDLIARRVIVVDTRGTAVGQGNALATIVIGQLTYGFPNRITATIAPGRGDSINVEREASLSGRLHTKGFLLLEGLLRRLLRADHPPAFRAAVAFEQSYGGVDGDSASGIEFCCLLSALVEVPLRQDLAMTGAIDQMGRLMAIGGVNEKIEGFFDACSHEGITGTQGVIVPASNVADLMLRHDVVEAAAEGRFHVYGLSRIEDALEVLTGIAAGEADARGRYPPDTLLGMAQARARAFWEASDRRRYWRRKR